MALSYREIISHIFEDLFKKDLTNVCFMWYNLYVDMKYTMSSAEVAELADAHV